MLNSVIRFALNQPLLIVAIASLVVMLGLREWKERPKDVFPDLNRPRVVLLTEAPGYPPEEVETLITIPLESALTGATGVVDVRSSSGVGLSVIYVEFDWGTDIYTDRQIVTERLILASNNLPPEITPQLAPISSIMGQVMMIALTLDEKSNDEKSDLEKPTSLLQLRQMADWVIRRRLLSISGVAQVYSMGGEKGGARQVQVLLNPDEMRRMGITLHQIDEAVGQSNKNATGGYLIRGPTEYLVRSFGRIEKLDDLRQLVIDGSRKPPVLLEQVAEIKDGPEIPRGLAAYNGKPAVMLTITKQPGTDTKEVIEKIETALTELETSLPQDVQFHNEIYRQDHFIDRAIDNVEEALLHGFILVVVILFLFLLNFRTTLITITAIPLSIAITLLVFKIFGLSINTMTLGGLAVAIGELVDDAIVDVENIFRRLKENRLLEKPKHPLEVVFRASVEIRSSIVFATVLVVLVFIPLFALSGMEGRLISPLAVAYIVSILASLLVSLTVTPVLSCWLLSVKGKEKKEKDSPLLRGLKWLSGATILWSLRNKGTVMLGTLAMVSVAVFFVITSGRNFLPPFHEGSVQVTMTLPPGVSLDESNRIAQQVDVNLEKLEFVNHVGRRTGRAELDEHAEGVNTSELILDIDPDSALSREEQLVKIRETLDHIPGVESTSGRSATEQPLAHLISHMISGVKAQLAIKVEGNDLDILRQIAQQIRSEIEGVEGIVDLAVEQQVLIPQLQIVLNRAALARYGMTPGEVNHIIETALQGRTVSSVLENEASFDLVVRLDDPYRQDMDALRQMTLKTPQGNVIALEDIADIYPDRAGPNTIKRENARRRIVIQCNASGRALSDLRDDIQRKLKPIEESLAQYGPGYKIKYSGQFESEQAATRMIGFLSLLSLAGMFLVLYSLFRSTNLALQVMAALPMAAIGAVAALVLTGQNLSVPALVGFVALLGIASRNGILLLNHYLHLVEKEGETLTLQMIVRAGKERVAPVLMTALTSGIGLVPIIITGDDPGREILYPVATVIVGGLVTCTLLEFFVRPVLFWTFGQIAAQRVLDARKSEILSDTE